MKSKEALVNGQRLKFNRYLLRFYVKFLQVERLCESMKLGRFNRHIQRIKSKEALVNRQRLKFYFLQFYAKFWQMELDEIGTI